MDASRESDLLAGIFQATLSPPRAAFFGASSQGYDYLSELAATLEAFTGEPASRITFANAELVLVEKLKRLEPHVSPVQYIFSCFGRLDAEQKLMAATPERMEFFQKVAGILSGYLNMAFLHHGLFPSYQGASQKVLPPPVEALSILGSDKLPSTFLSLYLASQPSDTVVQVVLEEVLAAAQFTFENVCVMIVWLLRSHN
jgi:hypothetical protein